MRLITEEYFKSTLTLQPFTITIEKECILKGIKTAKLGGLGRETWRSIRRGGGVQAHEVNFV
jgi:hypothetical protein